jgi:8-oxo-dGTP pyrophosphatase MutT (NUDIX family)
VDDFFKRDLKADGAKGLILIGSRMLVYRRDNKTKIYPLHIDLPGGGIEEGETPFEGFKREVKEEFNHFPRNSPTGRSWDEVPPRILSTDLLLSS